MVMERYMGQTANERLEGEAIHVQMVLIGSNIGLRFKEPMCDWLPAVLKVTGLGKRANLVLPAFRTFHAAHWP